MVSYDKTSSTLEIASVFKAPADCMVVLIVCSGLKK